MYLHRATRGIGRTQPVEWQDAGEALEHDELKGCLMPKGAAKDVNPPGAHLQYNEVSLHQGQSDIISDYYSTGSTLSTIHHK